MSKLNDIFQREIDLIKKDENTLSIVLVGSSKDLDFEDDVKINDIDLFIFTKEQKEDQIRINKVVSSVEFDLNYISREGCKNFIKNKEYFFLKINDGKIIFDTSNYAKDILRICKKAYEEGPDKIPEEIKKDKMIEIESEIKKLKQKDEFEDF